jgi:fatty acyl-CoA reductase
MLFSLIYIVFFFLFNSQALQLFNILLFKKYQDVYTVLDRRVKLVMRLADLYKPYVFFEGMYVHFIFSAVFG